MTGYDEERLAELLAALPTPPRGWVQAAQELPRMRAEADRLVARAEADAAFRRRRSSTISRRRCGSRASSRRSPSSPACAGTSLRSSRAPRDSVCERRSSALLGQRLGEFLDDLEQPVPIPAAGPAAAIVAAHGREPRRRWRRVRPPSGQGPRGPPHRRGRCARASSRSRSPTPRPMRRHSRRCASRPPARAITPRSAQARPGGGAAARDRRGRRATWRSSRRSPPSTATAPSRTDAVAAAALAEGAVVAAARLVELNLRTTPGDERSLRCAQLVEAARRTRASGRWPRRERPASPGLEPARGRGQGARRSRAVAGRAEPRLGARRLDRRGRPRLHPRQRRRGRATRPSARSQSSIAIVATDDGEPEAVPDEARDVCGHGTACAGIVRALAPDCELHSVRVLGEGMTGSGELILAGLRYAVEQDFDVVNMSLSTTKRRFAEVLHDLADTRVLPAHGARRVRAQPARRELPVALLVGDLRRQPRGRRLARLVREPVPARRAVRARRRRRRRLARTAATLRCSGNSFAAPHVSGIAALVLAKHPELTPFQLKSVLYATATNAGGDA